MWNNEFQPDRMAATEAMLAEFTEKTGIKTKLVAVPEDQLATLMTSAAAAGDLPDVVLGTPLDQSQQYAAEEIFDAEAAQAVVDKLGPDTFSEKALDLVSRDGVATGVPSDGWGQLLIYRKDLFDKAGLEGPRDARRRDARPRSSSTATAWRGSRWPPSAGDGFTAETFEHVALALGCQLVNDGGDVTLDSPECVDALTYYGDIAKQLLGRGQPGRRLHPRHVLRRPRGDDVLVAVPARRHGRPARRHEALLPGVQEEPGLPGREQRARRPAQRRGRRAEPVRRPCRPSTSPSTRRPRTPKQLASTC